MTFLYSQDLGTLPVQCPPIEYKPLSIVAYRWVFDDINNPENFKPLYYKNPKRVSSMDDLRKCQSMGLSMFDSIVNATKRFKFYKNSIGPSVYKTLGTKIAKENITGADGVNSVIDRNGHFSHHPAEGCDYASRFIFIAQLP